MARDNQTDQLSKSRPRGRLCSNAEPIPMPVASGAVGACAAVHLGPLVVALKHQVRDAPNVDLGYDAGNARRGLAYKRLRRGMPSSTIQGCHSIGGRLLFGRWRWLERGRDRGPPHRLQNPLQADARADRSDEGDLDQINGPISRRVRQFSPDDDLAKAGSETASADHRWWRSSACGPPCPFAIATGGWQLLVGPP